MNDAETGNWVDEEGRTRVGFRERE